MISPALHTYWGCLPEKAPTGEQGARKWGQGSWAAAVNGVNGEAYQDTHCFCCEHLLCSRRPGTIHTISHSAPQQPRKADTIIFLPLLNSFIEVSFTYHKISPLSVYSSMSFIIFTELAHHHPNQMLEICLFTVILDAPHPHPAPSVRYSQVCLCSVSVGLSVLDISCKRNHKLCGRWVWLLPVSIMFFRLTCVVGFQYLNLFY